MLWFLIPMGIAVVLAILVAIFEDYEKIEGVLSVLAIGVIIAGIFGSFANMVASSVGDKIHHITIHPLVALPDGKYADVTSVSGKTRYNIITKNSSGVTYVTQDVVGIKTSSTVSPRLVCDQRWHADDLNWRLWGDRSYATATCTLIVPPGTVTN